MIRSGLHRSRGVKFVSISVDEFFEIGRKIRENKRMRSVNDDDETHYLSSIIK